MEQQPSGTLRIVGIVLISVVVLIVALLTILLSLCMFLGGRNPASVGQYLVIGGVGGGMMAIGIIAIVYLARGLPRRIVPKEPQNKSGV